jgi:hypothetical protein
MKKLFTLFFVSAALISCSQDNEVITNEEVNAIGLEERVSNGEFDNSKNGIYEGTFTTLDASYRATVHVFMDGKNNPVAELRFPDLSKASIKSNSKVSKSQDTDVIKFDNNDVSFDLKLEAKGMNPVVSNVTYKGKEGDIILFKETSKQAVSPKTGSYNCLACNHPELGPTAVEQTFNMIFTPPLGDITIQVTLIGANGNNNVYTGVDAIKQTSRNSTTIIKSSTLSGSFMAGSGPVQVTGEHIWLEVTDCSSLRGNFVYNSKLFGPQTLDYRTDGPTGSECI